MAGSTINFNVRQGPEGNREWYDIGVFPRLHDTSVLYRQTPIGVGFIPPADFSPTATLSVSGLISAGYGIGNVAGTSHDWISTYITTNTYSADWNNTFTIANAGSADWHSVYSTTNTNSGNWEIGFNQGTSVYSTTNANSANWSNTHTIVNAGSADWDSVYSTVKSNSGDGTANKVLKWDSTGKTPTDSIITSNAGTVTVAGNLTVNGTTTTVNTQDTLIKDKLVTLNDGGAADTGFGVGIEVEEDGSPTGYIKTGITGEADRWEFLAPDSTYKTALKTTDKNSLITIGADLTIYNTEGASDPAIDQNVSTTANPSWLGATIGNIQLAPGINDNRITTSTGDLELDATGNDIVLLAPILDTKAQQFTVSMISSAADAFTFKETKSDDIIHSYLEFRTEPGLDQIKFHKLATFSDILSCKDWITTDNAIVSGALVTRGTLEVQTTSDFWGDVTMQGNVNVGTGDDTVIFSNTFWTLKRKLEISLEDASSNSIGSNTFKGIIFKPTSNLLVIKGGYNGADFDRIGILTSVPDYELDVRGDIGLDRYLHHNDDTDTRIEFVPNAISLSAGGVNFVRLVSAADVGKQYQAEVAINEGGEDVDFRVESENTTHALYVSGTGDGQIGIGTSEPTDLLTVAGNISGRDVLVTNHGNVSGDLHIGDHIATGMSNLDSGETIPAGVPLVVVGAMSARDGSTIGDIQLGVTATNEIDTLYNNLIIDSADGTTTIDDILIVTGNTTLKEDVTIGDAKGDVTTFNSDVWSVVNSTAVSLNDEKLHFDTNTLVIDSSANRVGIGTSTPNEQLTVVGSISSSSTLSATQLDGYNFIGGRLGVGTKPTGLFEVKDPIGYYARRYESSSWTNTGLSNINGDRINDGNTTLKAFDIDGSAINSTFLLLDASGAAGGNLKATKLVISTVTDSWGAGAPVPVFDIERSTDLSSWTSVAQISLTQDNNDKVATWDNTTAYPYWRLKLTTWSNNGPDISEVQFYESYTHTSLFVDNSNHIPYDEFLTDIARVGIGTNVPVEALTISGSISASGTLSATNSEAYNYLAGKTGVGTTTTTPDTDATITVGGDVAAFYTAGIAFWGGETPSNANKWNLYAGTDGKFYFTDKSGGTYEHNLVIDGSNGFVGIGTDAPTYDLDVVGNIGLDEYIYHNDDGNTFIRFRDDRLTTKVGNIDIIDLNTAASQNTIVFNEGGTDVDFRIETGNRTHAVFAQGDTGYIGIGTDDPEEALTVFGNISASGSLSASNPLNWNYIAGRVGIGETKPLHKLTVAGTISARNDIYGNSAYLSGGIDVHGNSIFGSDSSDAIIYNAGTWTIANATNVAVGGIVNFDSNTFVIDPSTDRAGAGTATPTSKFEIQNSSADGQLHLRHNSTYFSGLSTDSAGNLHIKPYTGKFTTFREHDVKLRKIISEDTNDIVIETGSTFGDRFIIQGTGESVAFQVDSNSKTGSFNCSPSGNIGFMIRGTDSTWIEQVGMSTVTRYHGYNQALKIIYGTPAGTTNYDQASCASITQSISSSGMSYFQGTYKDGVLLPNYGTQGAFEMGNVGTVYMSGGVLGFSSWLHMGASMDISDDPPVPSEGAILYTKNTGKLYFKSSAVTAGFDITKFGLNKNDGVAQSGDNSQSEVITKVSNAGGFSDKANAINAVESGSFAHGLVKGFTSSEGSAGENKPQPSILAWRAGGTAFGYAGGYSSTIATSGGFAHGYATNFGNIESRGLGSVVFGYARGSLLEDLNNNAWITNYAITSAHDTGSFAGGSNSGGLMCAKGAGSIAFGSMHSTYPSKTEPHGTTMHAKARGSIVLGSAAMLSTESESGFSYGGIDQARMEAKGEGSIVLGCAKVTTVTAYSSNAKNAQIEVKDNASGGFAWGYAKADKQNSNIDVAKAGGFAGGYARSGSIHSTEFGSFAGGYVRGVNVSSSNASAIKITSTAAGSFAFGHAKDAVIEATFPGAVAMGFADGTEIEASGKGALAMGWANGTQIQAQGDNSFQFGEGDNTVDDALQVGGTFRLRGKSVSSHPTSPLQNGDMWIKDNFAYIRSGGVNVKIEPNT
jgi:hypothetical protein